jgi:hypothetical protein
MRNIFIFGIAILLCCCSQNKAIAQSNTTPVTKTSKNIIKLNLGNFLFKNYGVQYERMLTKRWSASLGIRVMPSTTIPFKDLLFNSSDKELKEKFDLLRVSNIALTPEVRYYVSKKAYGRGFYLAPYYRYASFKLDNFITESNGTSTTAPIQVAMSGKFNSHSFGLMIGSQFSLSKKMVLDWWILGAHKGNGKASLTGNSSRPLTTQEQADIRKDLQNSNGSDINSSEIYVDANTIRYAFGMPWLGIRAGLSIGVKF